MSTYKSMSDAAYEIMAKKKRAIAFNKLWEDVLKETKVSEDLVAQFYSDLTLDSRFVQLKDNKWDLRSRRKFEEHYIDISKIDLEEDEEVEEEDRGSFVRNFYYGQIPQFVIDEFGLTPDIMEKNKV